MWLGVTITRKLRAGRCSSFRALAHMLRHSGDNGLGRHVDGERLEHFRVETVQLGSAGNMVRMMVGQQDCSCHVFQTTGSRNAAAARSGPNAVSTMLPDLPG